MEEEEGEEEEEVAAAFGCSLSLRWQGWCWGIFFLQSACSLPLSSFLFAKEGEGEEGPIFITTGNQGEAATWRACVCVRVSSQVGLRLPASLPALMQLCQLL